jgi:hypothetical protein
MLIDEPHSICRRVSRAVQIRRQIAGGAIRMDSLGIVEDGIVGVVDLKVLGRN